MLVVNNTPRLVTLLSVFRLVLCQLLLIIPELKQLGKGFYAGLQTGERLVTRRKKSFQNKLHSSADNKYFFYL